MIKFLFSFVFLFLAGCGHVVPSPVGWNEGRVRVAADSGDVLVVFSSHQPELVHYVEALVGRGGYSPADVVRVVPGLMVVVDSARLQGGPKPVFPPVSTRMFARKARVGEVGLMLGPDGLPDGRLLFVVGRTAFPFAWPDNVVVGTFVEKRGVMASLVRGDRVRVGE